MLTFVELSTLNISTSTSGDTPGLSENRYVQSCSASKAALVMFEKGSSNERVATIDKFLMFVLFFSDTYLFYEALLLDSTGFKNPMQR